MKSVERRFCEEFSPGYYGICTVGGMLSAGTTHLAVTPLDVLKVNMQVNPIKYSSISSGFSALWREQGPSSLWRGWSGKFFGYGVQGGCKFGLYEYFKGLYSNVLVDQNRTFVFFLSSASAQVFADVALCPFEAVKVRVQTQPTFAKGLADGFPKLYKTEGLTGFYKGLCPLWGRNLPFSMIMFSTFEHSVDFIYRSIIKQRKEDCSRAQQLGVTCLAGYAAGAVGTLVSNPADVIVSSLYNKKAENVLQAVKKIGLLNLFTRSLPVRITLVGPVVTLQWFFYDTIKVLCGFLQQGCNVVIDITCAVITCLYGYRHSSNNVTILGLLVEDFIGNYEKPIYHLKLVELWRRIYSPIGSANIKRKQSLQYRHHSIIDM